VNADSFTSSVCLNIKAENVTAGARVGGCATRNQGDKRSMASEAQQSGGTNRLHAESIYLDVQKLPYLFPTYYLNNLIYSIVHFAPERVDGNPFSV
jgi:hypothetical protein